MKLPFNVDLSDKVVALTGAGGAIISQFAEAMALCGAKVALLDINYEAAKAVADRIGENALAIETNALSKDSIIAAKKAINEKFGKVNFLVNGAGGNNPKGTTSKEKLELCDIAEKAEGVKTFFDLDPKGIEFVFISTSSVLFSQLRHLQLIW